MRPIDDSLLTPDERRSEVATILATGVLRLCARTGAIAFRREAWQQSVISFSRSAQLSQKDHAYDWLHVALARAHLGHAVQAHNFYDAAAEEIDKLEMPPPDLIEVRDRAKQLVDAVSMPESYYKFDRVFVEPDAHGLAAARQIRVGPDGNVYVACLDTDDVKVFDPTTGDLIHRLYTPAGELDAPWPMAFGPDGQLYVSGTDSNNVIRFDIHTGAAQVFVDAKDNGGLTNPKGLAFGPDGHLYAISLSRKGNAPDSSRCIVLRYDGTTGAPLGIFVKANSGGIDKPNAITFGHNGQLYLANIFSNSIKVYDGSTGEFLNTFVARLSEALDEPNFIEFHEDGLLYVGCQRTTEIKRFDSKSGALVDVVIPASMESSDLAGGVAGFAFDHDSRLYVSSGMPRTQPGNTVLRYTLRK